MELTASDFNKELLSDVLGVYVYKIDFIQSNKLFYKFTSKKGSKDYQVDNINVCELIFKKFKEWAYTKNMDIRSSTGLNIGYAWVFEGGVNAVCDAMGPSEEEAILQACEYIKGIE